MGEEDGVVVPAPVNGWDEISQEPTKHVPYDVPGWGILAKKKLREFLYRGRNVIPRIKVRIKDTLIISQVFLIELD